MLGMLGMLGMLEMSGNPRKMSEMTAVATDHRVAAPDSFVGGPG
ncbi:hypothetical protein LAUMK13_01986 [Mycobacterium innocens]|uniref:Uncharacterized protein n=1 Tax=Mycobacterium innocens TaxID=2341083 RepID=A0A498Q0V6_9MYCO|nr:hypothetical protein LAUMK13_01986 [Mycobacterium innocens]